MGQTREIPSENVVLNLLPEELSQILQILNYSPSPSLDLGPCTREERKGDEILQSLMDWLCPTKTFGCHPGVGGKSQEQYLVQGSHIFLLKGCRVNVLHFAGRLVWGNYSILPGEYESSHGQYINK